jgi:hypothetical protein
MLERSGSATRQVFVSFSAADIIRARCIPLDAMLKEPRADNQEARLRVCTGGTSAWRAFEMAVAAAA